MEILKITAENENTALKQAVFELKRKRVVICPTDTVYGLVADASDSSAVQRVFRIKKRKITKPLPVFVKDLKAAKRLAHINRSQARLLRRLWPGKVTVILEAKKKLPKGVVRDGKIGLRVPKYEFLNLLLKKTNIPLVATSANVSGKRSSRDISYILRQFRRRKHKPELVLDKGKLRRSFSSTVFDLTSLKILRRGAVSKKRILKLLKS